MTKDLTNHEPTKKIIYLVKKRLFSELEKLNLQSLDVGIMIVKKDYDELKKKHLKNKVCSVCGTPLEYHQERECYE